MRAGNRGGRPRHRACGCVRTRAWPPRPVRAGDPRALARAGRLAESEAASGEQRVRRRSGRSRTTRRPPPPSPAATTQPFPPLHRCRERSTLGGPTLAVPVVAALALNDDYTVTHGHVRRLSERGGGVGGTAAGRRATLLSFGTVPYPGQKTGPAGRSSLHPPVRVVGLHSYSPLYRHDRARLSPSRWIYHPVYGLPNSPLLVRSPVCSIRNDVLAARYASVAVRYSSRSSS